MSAARACGRIDVGKSASAWGRAVVVWFVLDVGIEVVGSGRVRVRVMAKRIVMWRPRESIVDQQWRWCFDLEHWLEQEVLSEVKGRR